MHTELRVAIIGLDTSHSVEFPRLMQAPDTPAAKRVEGLRAVTCLRFPTPFQSEQGQDKRQKQLEEWGVKVTADFDEAVAGCDVAMLEINDPAFHLRYFEQCAALGMPLFLDKPLADTVANGKRIVALAADRKLRVFSSSSLRFVPELEGACAQVPQPRFASVYGPLGKAPAGSSVVWYGVHAMEMLNRAMGAGALSVRTVSDAGGVVAVVAYPDSRRAVVELLSDSRHYGGCLRDKERAAPYAVDMDRTYACLMRQIAAFFRGGPAPVPMRDTLEIMALLEATQASVDQGGKEVPLPAQ